VTVPLRWLIAALLLYIAGVAIYAVSGARPSPLFVLLGTIALNWSIAWWILDDSRARRVPTFIDLGWFAFSAWPIVLPYHLFRTRGAAGCVAGGALVCGYLILYVIVNMLGR
jgi:hypothetical protein